MCDLLKCNAIKHPVPWLTSTCTLPWMMLGRHDWPAQVRGSPPMYRSQPLLRPILLPYVLIYHDLLVLIYIYIMETSQRKHCLVLQSCLCSRENAWSVVGFCVEHVFAQSAYYPPSKFRQRAHMQFLWEFFWLLNLFCNHYWRIPGAT